MSSASPAKRIVAFALTGMLLAFSGKLGSAQQTIDFSLNVFYATPSNINSGGTWSLEAKTSGVSDFGIGAVQAFISNINSTVALAAPNAVVDVNKIAGFELLANVLHPPVDPAPAYRELIIGQVPADQPVISPSEETLFYGVGTLTNGSPSYSGQQAGTNSIGPTFTTLTSPQNIPWATTDPFGRADWATGVILASGTFPTMVTPAFVSGSTGSVFTSLGTSTTAGSLANATTITTLVQSNLIAGADYNHNGLVDAADYVLWRKTLGTTVTPGSGADGSGNGIIDQADYNLWRAHFGLTSGAGSGSGLSGGAVPEPASCLLLVAGLLAIAARRNRCERAVNS